VLIEEFAFRGVLLALTIDMYGTVGGVALTSFLFGLWHISPSLEMHESHTATSGSVIPTVISTVVFTGLGGVMFAVLRLYTHSLFPPSALHWAMNGTGVVVGWFVHRNKDRAGAASSLDEDAA
jgi:membrane protease YdiL (CAAX protease family)